MLVRQGNGDATEDFAGGVGIMNQPAIRLEVNISAETAMQLRKLAVKKGTSVTNILRRAVGTKYFLDQELKSHPEKSLLIHNRREETITTLELM